MKLHQLIMRTRAEIKGKHATNSIGNAHTSHYSHIQNHFKALTEFACFFITHGALKKQKGLRVFTFLHEYANQHYNNKLQTYHHHPFEAFKITAGINTNKHKQ